MLLCKCFAFASRPAPSVDGAGKALTEVRALPNARLSSDCQPVLIDGAVTWYVNMMAGRMFYQIDIQ